MRVGVERESVDNLLEQHRAVLDYECLVESEQWGVIGAQYPDGPPECSCLVCRQLDAVSDRLVTLARDVRRYEKELLIANSRLNSTMTEIIDIAASRRLADLDAGGF